MGKSIAFGWYGGKYSHLDWLLPLLPPTQHFCDVFGGSTAVIINCHSVKSARTEVLWMNYEPPKEIEWTHHQKSSQSHSKDPTLTEGIRS